MRSIEDFWLRGRGPPERLRRSEGKARFCIFPDALCIVGAARLSSRFAGSPAEGVSAFMARDVVDSEVVESRDALVAWFEAGCKPDGPFRVGTEHEKVPFYRADHSPVPYGGERGIRALLEGMRAHLGWESIEDGENRIGLFDAEGGGAISLEPGGQFELSGAPLYDAHATAGEPD